MFQNQQYENNFFNAVDLMALVISILNLQENRAQTAYNDVHAANDKQAEFLLGEIRKMIDEQNRRLERQDEVLAKLTAMIERLANGD